MTRSRQTAPDDDDVVTAGATARYLRDHPRCGDTLEVLILHGTMAYVRWPSGVVRWQTRQSLVDAGHVLPARGILQQRPA